MQAMLTINGRVPHRFRLRKGSGFAFYLAALRIASFAFTACLEKSRKPLPALAIPPNPFLQRMYYCANMCCDNAAAIPRAAPLAR